MGSGEGRIQDLRFQIQDSKFKIPGVGMRYQRFEELPVWQTAIELAARTFQMTSDAAFRRQHSLRDQIERAAVSISNNIAEGFERGTNAELLAFLYIARGSAGEVRSMLHLLRRLDGFSLLESAVSNLESLSESVSRQLGGWIESLKNSDFQGSRHQNAETRQVGERSRRRDQFLDELKRIQEDARRPPDEDHQ
jgi:four helix bundle protein